MTRWTPLASIRFPGAQPASSWATATSLGRRIGRGAMGEVYEAQHVRLPGHFAVKLLLPELQGNQDAFARFCREAEIMSQLRHPNIVQIFDFNVAPDARPYFVMEYLQGRDLEARLRVGPAVAAGRHAHRRRGLVGAGARARARRRAPRSEAGEHLPGHRRRADGRAGEGARLRHLEGPRRGRPDLAARSICSGPPLTWRPNRRAGRPTRSTGAPISSRWRRSRTGC